jgi:hypothetical protein
MATEVWKGYGVEGQAVTDAGVVVTIPNNDRAYVVSVDNEGANTVRVVLNTALADYVADSGVVIRADKAYTFVSRNDNQQIRSVLLICATGETATVNVSFS